VKGMKEESGSKKVDQFREIIPIGLYQIIIDSRKQSMNQINEGCMMKG